ncbi:MAG: TfoX/Sxy family protein [Alphaproteobacteria bacterium]|nr:TfoX/Sxy family protein [Alphaproteobacteria bacterium]
MASSKDFLDFVLEQLSDLLGIDYRAMMGEYIIYYQGKVIGGIYDNRLLIKPTASALKIISKPQMEIPYKNASPMIMITDIENRDLLVHLFNAVYPELPEKKKRTV